ncbi:putative ABC transport system permease protein [Amycolatopsis saalfeldensis]|uniref:Putative ABC transport system permease protein n=2 Tax=Amycolatopsis saalfeldensis TaxID=394193 RepID=A0A1H8PTZ4_9PSEU|nr:putative ABC transport system permease protein [Amycolatopsis saalfeldensis]
MIWRQPTVVLAVLAAAVLVALPAASISLFLSSAGTATLQKQADAACEWAVGAQWRGQLPVVPRNPQVPEKVGKPLLDARLTAVRQAEVGIPDLSPPVSTLISGANVTAATGTPVHPEQRLMNLVARDGFADHVQVLSGGTGPGIWLPDQFANLQQLKVGDRVSLTRGSTTGLGAAGGDTPLVTLRVAAVYRDLRSLPDEQYWCSLKNLYRGSPLSNAGVYPMALLSSDDLFKATDPDSGAGSLVESSVGTTGLTTASAAPVIDGLERLRARTADPQDPLGLAFSHAQYTTSLRGMSERADEVTSALVTTVVPMGAVGALAGLVIAAAAGSFWVDRRRAELAVLSARGVGPWALVGKAVLETGAVVALGSVAGWFAARYLVAAVGPSPLVTPGAVTGSVLAGAGALLVTLGAIAVASGRRITAHFDTRATRARLWPWELIPLVAAVVCYFVLGDGTVSGLGTAGSVAGIPPRLVVVPLLLVIGLALFAARIVRWSVVRANPVKVTRPVSFLSWQRIASGPAAAAVLIAATAIPVALSVYATTVTGSVDRTLHAESQLIVGSDVVLGLTGPAHVPPDLAGRTSLVDRYDSGHVGSTTVNVLGVDPETFATTAFWDDALPGPTLAELMGKLAAPGAPAGILAGLPATPASADVRINGQTTRLSITTVAQLPGKNSGFPQLLVRKDLLDRLAGENAHSQLWMRGDPARNLAALSGTGTQIGTISQAQEVTANGVYAAITYTFVFLTAVSVLAGAIVLVGLLLYLNARARARRSAYVLLRRMGIGPPAHWRALLYEVGGLLIAGFAFGLVFAAVAVAVTSPGYDLDPGIAPGTLISAPWSLALRLAAATLLAAVLATLAAQRAVSRARPAEVLRDTE